MLMLYFLIKYFINVLFKFPGETHTQMHTSYFTEFKQENNIFKMKGRGSGGKKADPREPQRTHDE